MILRDDATIQKKHNRQAPAFRKNRKSAPIVAAVAGPSPPARSFPIPANAETLAAEYFNPGKDLSSIEISPHGRNSQTIYASLHAVVTASTVNSDHGSQSFFRVDRTNLYVLRTMIAITAAPTP